MAHSAASILSGSHHQSIAAAVAVASSAKPRAVHSAMGSGHLSTTTDAAVFVNVV